MKKNQPKKTTKMKTIRKAAAPRQKTIEEKKPIMTEEEWNVVEQNLHPKHSFAAKMKSRKTDAIDCSPHVIVEARAGTGKSTTMLLGVVNLFDGDPTLLPAAVAGKEMHITPSPQQLAIWEAIYQSHAKVHTVHMVAFNKPIADELSSKLLKLHLPSNVTASTVHSLGFKAVTKAFGRVAVSSYRVQDIISEILERDIRELRKYKPVLLKATEELVSLCKQNLSHLDSCGNDIKIGDPDWTEVLSRLAAHYDVDLNGSSSEVFALVPKVLERCKDVARDNAIDFNDMIWIPIAAGLNVPKYDLLLVDEAQDLNRCQQALAKQAGRRLILCGDPRQAIYGFAGADAESMPRMAKELGETDRGCITLPLTVTRRCGKAIVKEANKVVKDFEAHESNCEGTISREPFAEVTVHGETENVKKVTRCYTQRVEDGDMVLCRVNAPLVSQCFRFLKAGRKATIQGRDVGAGLISTINKMKANNVAELQMRLSDWLHNETRKEQSKRNPSESRLIALQDRYDCIAVFMEEQKTVADVIKRIETIFTDDKNGAGVKFSSVHRAKGLEARRVFILQPKGAEMPHPMAKSKWQVEAEMNIKYVAITRAIEELVYVS